MSSNGISVKRGQLEIHIPNKDSWEKERPKGNIWGNIFDLDQWRACRKRVSQKKCEGGAHMMLEPALGLESIERTLASS